MGNCCPTSQRTAESVYHKPNVGSLEASVHTYDAVTSSFPRTVADNEYTESVSTLEYDSRRQPLQGEENEYAQIEDISIQIQVQRLGKYLVNAAIDLGTTYSGYAFAPNSTETKIQLPHWTSGQGVYYKAPTAVLFSPQKKFLMFGFEAMNYMHENSHEDSLQDYYFFQDFKMMLYSLKDLSIHTMLSDISGTKQLPAIQVFSSVIQFFKEHLINLLQKQLAKDPPVDVGDIFWVITVPAIWNLKAKQFMRQAADRAGLSSSQIAIALEPEAASILCRTSPMYISQDDGVGGVRQTICSMPENSTYLVIDIGGGTVDITLHKILQDKGLQELMHARGGNFGGNQVNKQFTQFIKEVFGSKVVEEIRTKHTADWLELVTNFEMKKRSDASVTGDSKVVVRLPLSFVETFRDFNSTDIQSHVQTLDSKDKIEIFKDKIRIQGDIFISFFDLSIDGIVKCIQQVLENYTTDTILVVGGYAESTILTNHLRSHFSKHKVVIPEDPSLSVLKGAVMFGFDPTIIRSRVCRYTYGIAKQKPFVVGEDSESKKRLYNGRYYCDDVFDKHVEIGETLKLGTYQEAREYHPVRHDQVVVVLEMYASNTKDPRYVDDPSCELVGVMEIETSPRKSGEDGTVLVRMNLSGTELEIEAQEKSTGNVTRATCNFLG